MNNPYLTDIANVVEMVLLDHDQNEHDVPTEQAWQTLESKIGIIKGKNVRPSWKNPTPTGNRSIIFGTTKIEDRKYDGAIYFDGVCVAVFRLGRLAD